MIMQPKAYFWSLRREIWEHRFIYLAPPVIALLALIGFLFGLLYDPDDFLSNFDADPVNQIARLMSPYGIVALAVSGTAILGGFYYCLDALYSERRDRSILFWKSLPVSDLTAVLAKATTPLVILPAMAFPIIVIVQVIMVLATTVVVVVKDLGPATFWLDLPFFGLTVLTLYGLVVATLWTAPIYGWFMLVSAWASRAVFLWCILPPAALALGEKLMFHTDYIGRILSDRLNGYAASAFEFSRGEMILADPLSGIRLGQFLSTPGLWIGLIFTAIFLAAAIRLRRYRGAI